VSEMIQRLSRARSALDRLESDLADDQRKLDGLRGIQSAREADAKKLEEAFARLREEWSGKVNSFNATCATRPMREDSAEYIGRLQQRADMAHTEQDYRRRFDQLIEKHDALKQAMVQDFQQLLTYGANLEALKKWMADVEPGLRSLEAAIATKCKKPGSCAARWRLQIADDRVT